MSLSAFLRPIRWLWGNEQGPLRCSSSVFLWIKLLKIFNKFQQSMVTRPTVGLMCVGHTTWSRDTFWDVSCAWKYTLDHQKGWSTIAAEVPRSFVVLPWFYPLSCTVSPDDYKCKDTLCSARPCRLYSEAFLVVAISKCYLESRRTDFKSVRMNGTS